MQIVPTQPIPNQTLQVNLGGQACILNIYQQAYGLYVDVYVGSTLIIAGVIALNANRIVRSLYLGFLGDFVFFDTQDANDPEFSGLGTRYSLVYLEQADLPPGQG